MLIGDPKQAIYAFRGADVYAYLDAARAATTQATLQVNWRSDEGLLRAYDTMFGGAKLGDEGIVYRTVEAAPPNRAPRLHGRAGQRAAARALPAARRRDDDPPGLRVQRAGARAHRPGPGRGPRPAAELGCGDRAPQRGRHPALARSGLPGPHRRARAHAPQRGAHPRRAGRGRRARRHQRRGQRVRHAAARDWMRLLAAIERPADPRRAHTAALTPFLGWTAEKVAAADDDAWEDVHQRLHHWARVLREKGVAALTETIALVEGLPGRVLADTSGERRLTDLRHVGAAAARRGQDRADGHGRAGHLAARADRLGRAGGRRGAQPPAGVRRRGRAGADDPPQQGPRVPDRLLPVPVGAGLHPAAAGRSPTTTRRPATRGAWTSGSAAPPTTSTASSSSSSSAARTCGWPTSR